MIRFALFLFFIVAFPSLVFCKELLGAGATFPFPLYSKLFDDYFKEVGVPVNYQAIGSGGGIRQLRSGTVDFAGSDAFISDTDLKKFKSQVLHIPTCIGAVVLAYNVPGVQALKVSGGVISDIYLGRVTYWDDPRIKSINPGIRLPHLRIAVIHRSDGSGTTHVFTEYLSTVSLTWRARIGYGKSVNWPVGLGGKGNPGVAGLIRQIPGSIGYIEMVYAIQSKIPMASVKNNSGCFVRPSVESLADAVPVKIPLDTRISLVNTRAVNGYPITGFTWLIVYRDLKQQNRSKEDAQKLKSLLVWVCQNTNRYALKMGYGELPFSIREINRRNIDTLSYGDLPLN